MGTVMREATHSTRRWSRTRGQEDTSAIEFHEASRLQSGSDTASVGSHVPGFPLPPKNQLPRRVVRTLCERSLAIRESYMNRLQLC